MVHLSTFPHQLTRCFSQRSELVHSMCLFCLLSMVQRRSAPAPPAFPRPRAAPLRTFHYTRTNTTIPRHLDVTDRGMHYILIVTSQDSSKPYFNDWGQQTAPLNFSDPINILLLVDIFLIEKQRPLKNTLADLGIFCMNIVLI